jgi:hypothetical protein
VVKHVQFLALLATVVNRHAGTMDPQIPQMGAVAAFVNDRVLIVLKAIGFPFCYDVIGEAFEFKGS